MKKLDRKETLIVSIVSAFLAVTIVLAFLFGFDAFDLQGKKAYTTRVVEGGIEITGYKGSASQLSIPSSIGGKRVVGIAANAFSRNKKLKSAKSVKFPSSLVYIEDGAFAGMTKLDNITLPKNLEVIGDNAFLGCTKLSNIKLENGSKLRSVGSHAFLNTPFEQNLRPRYGYYMWDDIAIKSTGLFSTDQIVVPSDIRVLGKDCFSGNSRITKISFASGSKLEHISNGGFLAMPALKEVDLEAANKLESVGSQAFASCPLLKTVKMTVVKKVGSSAFASSESLQSIEFGRADVELGANLFEGNLQNLEISISAGAKNTKRAFVNKTFSRLSVTLMGGEMSDEFAEAIGKIATKLDLLDRTIVIVPDLFEKFEKLEELLISPGNVDNLDRNVAAPGSLSTLTIRGSGTQNDKITKFCGDIFAGIKKLYLAGIAEICDGAFAGISSLVDVAELDDGVARLGYGVFENTTWLDALRNKTDSDQFVKVIGGTLLFAKSANENSTLVLPEGILRIDSHSLNANSVIFPASIEGIGSNAFLIGVGKYASWYNGWWHVIGRANIAFADWGDGTSHLERIEANAFSDINILSACLWNWDANEGEGAPALGSLILSNIKFVGKNAILLASDVMQGKNGIFGSTICMGSTEVGGSIALQNGIRVVAEQAFANATCSQQKVNISLCSSLVYVGQNAFDFDAVVSILDIGATNCEFGAGAFAADKNTQIYVRKNLENIYDLAQILDMDLSENEIFVSEVDFARGYGALLPNAMTYEG